MYVGVCCTLTTLRLLKTYWPHFEKVNELLVLKTKEKELMMKRQLVDYLSSWIKNEA
jgi:hypothetical protein